MHCLLWVICVCEVTCLLCEIFFRRSVYLCDPYYKPAAVKIVLSRWQSQNREEMVLLEMPDKDVTNHKELQTEFYKINYHTGTSEQFISYYPCLF